MIFQKNKAFNKADWIGQERKYMAEGDIIIEKIIDIGEDWARIEVTNGKTTQRGSFKFKSNKEMVRVLKEMYHK